MAAHFGPAATSSAMVVRRRWRARSEEPFGQAPFILGLKRRQRGQDALVAYNDEGGQHHAHRDESHEAARDRAMSLEAGSLIVALAHSAAGRRP